MDDRISKTQASVRPGGSAGRESLRLPLLSTRGNESSPLITQAEACGYFSFRRPLAASTTGADGKEERRAEHQKETETRRALYGKALPLAAATLLLSRRGALPRRRGTLLSAPASTR